VQKGVEPLLAQVCQGVTVRQVTTGGGFGGKEDYPDMIGAHAALLAWKTNRPVKIAYDRHEDIVATTKRHPSHIRHRTGVKKDGTLVAMDIEVILDGGAYVTLSPVVLSRGVLHAAGPYRCPNVRVRGRVLATNTAPNGAFRGFGAPQVQFAMERQMDLVAHKVGLDPLALRLKNAYRVGDATATGQVLEESVSALEALQTGAQRADYLSRHAESERRRQERDENDPEPMQGIGLSLSWHGSGFTGNGERLLQARAAVELREDGLIHVLTSSTDFGQGTNAVLAQIVADAAGVPVDQVKVDEPSTDSVPDSGPTVASRTVMIVGGVLERAARELARKRHGAQLPLRVEAQYEPRDEAAFDEENYRGTAYPAYGWGCHVVQVAVDPDTLEVTPLSATLVFDVGKAIHPVLCKGQVEGGSLQGFAYGYLEEVKLERGRYLNDRLSTYIIPTIKDAPRMDTLLLENATSAGPSGAKGVGELPLDGAAPALLAAIENATGIRGTSLPATPERLLDLLLAKEEV
jgi:CO/xanthine dehydrogenase Mo-binding subunit